RPPRPPPPPPRARSAENTEPGPALQETGSRRLPEIRSQPRHPIHEQPRRAGIGMTKIRQKVSGTMRTQNGAENFADLRSHLQTTVKHGIQALTVLTQLTCR